MSSTGARKELGKKAESEAEKYLRKKHGYRILIRNFFCRWGEIDLICREGKTLVFVEVRAAGAGGFEGPAASVIWKKQKQIIKAAKYFILTKRIGEMDMRFDVVGVKYGTKGKAEFELFRNAFELPPE